MMPMNAHGMHAHACVSIIRTHSHGLTSIVYFFNVHDDMHNMRKQILRMRSSCQSYQIIIATCTAHSILWTGRTTVNALTQSIFEYRRREKRSTKRLRSATAVNKHVKKIETKNKNVRHLRKIGFLPIFASEKRCGRVVDIEFLSEIEKKHAQWTPHAMAP